jgi:hypothetical protein
VHFVLLLLRYACVGAKVLDMPSGDLSAHVGVVPFNCSLALHPKSR